MKKQKTKVKPKGYFAGGDIASIGSMAASLAGNFASAANYQFDPNAAPYKPNLQAGLSQGLVGIIPELIKASADKKQRSAYVASATPGNYQQGGPIRRTDSLVRKSRPSIDGISQSEQTYLSIPRPTVSVNPLTQLLPFTPTTIPNTIPYPVSIPNSGSSKSKSKDRQREMADGGPVVPAISQSEYTTKASYKDKGADFSGRGVLRKGMKDKTPSAFGTRIGYAAGGAMDEDSDPNDTDDQLSNEAFQVKGAPSTRDGNYYPQMNVNLDHNEVVKDNFVFSNRLKHPQTGKTFASEAARLEKSTGKSEKMLRTNPNDSIAKNTIKQNEGAVASLAKLQEMVAAAKGLRNSTPSQGLAYGGPTDPPYTFIGESSNKKLPIANISPSAWLDLTNPYDNTTGKRKRPVGPDTFIGTKLGPGQAAMDLGRDGLFYDPYSKRFTVRNTQGEYVGVQPNQGQFDVQGSTIKDLTNGKSYNVDEHLRYMNSPKLDTTGPTGPQLDTPSNLLYNPPEVADPQLGAFPHPVDAPTTSTVPTPTATSPRGVGKVTPAFAPVDYSTAQSDYEARQPQMNPDQQAYADRPLAPISDAWRPPAGPVTSTTTPTTPDVASALNFGKSAATATTPGTAGLGQDFTFGDALQALKVGSQFGQLIGGSEKERPNYDLTPITKENYDPSNPLYQSNRNFQSSLNSLQNSSINQNRAFMNNLYVGKLNQDSDILSKYNQMNQQSRTQYESRLADQRRYNIGQTVSTNDINARNRAAYKQAVDTAFSSLGNFGQALNTKKTSYDSLNILKTMYPDVYVRVLAAQGKTT